MSAKRLTIITLVIFIALLAVPSALGGFWEFFNSITGYATTGEANLTIDIGNTNPFVDRIVLNNGSSWTLTENGIAFFTVTGTVNDSDGVSNLGTGALVSLNISLNGSVVQSINYNKSLTPRINSSCTITDISALSAKNFTCVVTMAYFDPPSTSWAATVGVMDTNGATNESNTTLTINTLGAIRLGPDNLTWGTSLALGATNISAAQNITVNNTGNLNISQVNLTAFNLVRTGSSDIIPASNFSISASSTEACAAAGVNTNGTFHNISVILANTTLRRGNYSQRDGVNGVEEYFVCLRQVPTTIGAGRYASNYSWLFVVPAN